MRVSLEDSTAPYENNEPRWFGLRDGPKLERYALTVVTQELCPR